MRPGEHHPRRAHASRRGTLDELRHLTRTSITAETATAARRARATSPASTVWRSTADRVRFDVDTRPARRVQCADLASSACAASTSHPPTLEELFLRHYGDELAHEREVVGRQRAIASDRSERT